jgi:hypothetical protein
MREIIAPPPSPPMTAEEIQEILDMCEGSLEEII